MATNNNGWTEWKIVWWRHPIRWWKQRNRSYSITYNDMGLKPGQRLKFTRKEKEELNEYVGIITAIKPDGTIVYTDKDGEKEVGFTHGN